MLDGLEGADDRAELSARFGVLKAGVQTRLRDPELFVGQDHLSSLLGEGNKPLRMLARGDHFARFNRSSRQDETCSLPALIEPVLYGPFKGIGVEQEDERLTALIVRCQHDLIGRVAVEDMVPSAAQGAIHPV